MSDLKPCPFCGGPARITHGIGATVFVHCRDDLRPCTASVSCHADEAAAIERWNSRAPNPPGV